MSTEKVIFKKISSKITASVIGAQMQTRLDQKLWAINWFDLKRPWLYELYNKVVVRHLLNVGGKPLFKGKTSKIILDNERLKRDMLLIVQYPNAEAFLNLISLKTFQIKGLLRSLSVKYFQFGFMNQIKNEIEIEETPQNQSNSKLKYLIHICEGSQIEHINRLLDHIESKEVFPFFVGEKSALVGLQKETSKMKTLDFMLNHVLVFGGLDEEALELLINSNSYQDFIHHNKNNFISFCNRKI